MKPDRQTRLLLGWLCALTLLFSALAPSGTYALASALDVPVPWNAVCTSTGPQRVAGTVDPGSDIPSDRGTGGQSGHCPFCLLQGGTDVLPSSAPVLHPAFPRVAATVQGAADLPRRAPVWPTAQSRAPPPAS